MLLTVTTCLMFCTIDASPIPYVSLERCKEQGFIIAGMQKAHLPRLNVVITGNVTIECKDESGKVYLFIY